MGLLTLYVWDAPWKQRLFDRNFQIDLGTFTDTDTVDLFFLCSLRLIFVFFSSDILYLILQTAPQKILFNILRPSEILSTIVSMVGERSWSMAMLAFQGVQHSPLVLSWRNMAWPTSKFKIKIWPIPLLFPLKKYFKKEKLYWLLSSMLFLFQEGLCVIAGEAILCES